MARLFVSDKETIGSAPILIKAELQIDTREIVM
jgi:hypothetical protein